MATIVIVSHSEDVANGTKALLNNMAKGVKIIAYGGVDNGLGTSLDEVKKVLNNIDDDPLCFYDLGSAEMNIDLAIETYKGPFKIKKVNAPIVEGSFVAAVKLSVGGSVNEAIEEIDKASFKSTAFK
ncbi:dihydroxyacetone kinase phosphoryl donor subunit DhaM [Staphylococcus petrasii]|uniref:dihydroxyacetone kinase phosphoryl donor subunit DhaM n=1 Tax=Staphylococcus petrasii TaxID=1276936 RepID=UPI000CD01F63|nr:dihydroxyacetone kinase phosphoryl donor subunit DhaM [Staphylococcus petrasii]PNZ83164.1 PTS-dependent dihydroxyacetone kinase phosphotransferase subunit DhaM [Staphylococcus petrasii]TGA82098.1 PTS-dependent dihydroxyacetone kinase phosphotransferase subunit DhaM [Staphylococcus petrasii]SUM60749.1 phosphotransferase mannnose-specific family component IIA [Staphylococcus petrasii]